MKRINAFFPLFLLLVIFASSCSSFKEIKIGNLRNLEVKGFENNKLALEVKLPVENPNPYNVKVKDANIRVMNGDSELGRVVQMDNLVISGNSNKEYPVNLTVELTGIKKDDLFSVFKIFSNKAGLRIAGEIKASYLLYNKSIKIDYPLMY